MKISFLVTFYNQGQYVDDCMRGIQAISHCCDYEIIAGDDGSKDNTIDELNKWGKIFGDKLKIISVNRNDGVSDAVVRASNLRKKLLQNCRGDFFCILDGDDFYCDTEFVHDAIEIMLHNQDVSIVMFNMNYYQDGIVMPYMSKMKQGLIETGDYIKFYYSPAGACIYRKYETDDFFDILSKAIYYDDNDIVIYSARYGNLWYIDRPIMNYRQHQSSIWHSMSRAQQGLLNVVGAVGEIYLNPRYIREIYYRYRRDILYTYFRRKQQEKFVGKECLEKYKDMSLCANALTKVLLDYKNSTWEQQQLVEAVIGNLQEDDPETYSVVKANCDKENV